MQTQSRPVLTAKFHIAYSMSTNAPAWRLVRTENWCYYRCERTALVFTKRSRLVRH